MKTSPVLTAYTAGDLENSRVAWDTPVALEPALLQAGYGLSMARDNATGVLHLSYLEFSNSSETPGVLVYQNGTGTHWNEPVIVDDTIGFYHRDVPESVRHTSIALGPDGLPHIAYMSWSNGYQLKYARMLRAGERTWTPGGDIPDRQFPGEEPGNRTWYTGAERAGSGWLVTSASTPGGLAGWGASLAVDSNNEPRFSYLGQKGYSSPVMLMYGTYNASVFQQVNMKSAMFTFVPNPVTGLYGSLPFVYWPEHTRAGIQTSIALDPAGRPLISYSGDTSGNFLPADSAQSADCGNNGQCLAHLRLIHTHLNSTVSPAAIIPFSFWEIAPIATGPEPSSSLKSRAGNVLYPSMAIDARDAVHIASSEQRTVGEKVKGEFSKSATGDNANWTDISYVYYTVVEPGSAPRTEVVGKSAAKNDMYPALRLDARNSPRMAWADSMSGTIRYAIRTNGTWVTTGPSGTESGPAQFVNLALDSGGNPQIVYFDAAGERLKYLHGVEVRA